MLERLRLLNDSMERMFLQFRLHLVSTFLHWTMESTLHLQGSNTLQLEYLLALSIF